LEAFSALGELTRDLRKEERKVVKDQRDLLLIEKAWDMLESGTISEFEIGDVRVLRDRPDPEHSKHTPEEP